MSNIVLLFLCMLIGVALRRYDRVADNAHAAINGFIINVSLPALTLLQIRGIKLPSTLVYAIAMPWLLFTLAVLFLLGRLEYIAIYAGYHRRVDSCGRPRQYVLRGPADD